MFANLRKGTERLAGEWRCKSLALTHKAVQELHVEQSLGRHDSVCLLQDRGDLFSNILDYLWMHGKVVQPSSLVNHVSKSVRS